jgi:hypothetical protein
VRCILRRDLYRGVLTWNQSQKRDQWGRQRQHARPETQWITREVPELRLIADDVWQAAQARLAATRPTLATAHGPRPIVRRDLSSPYLLSGFGRCGVCGWSMTIITRPHGTKPHRRRVSFLGCLSHYKRGPAVCSNGRLVRLEVADARVLEALARDTLDPDVVRGIVDLVFAQFAPTRRDATVAALTRDLRGVDAKIATLTSAIEKGGGALPPLIARLAERQQERDRLVAAIGAAGALSALQGQQAAVEAKVLAHITRLRAYLGWPAVKAGLESVEDGRTALRETLAGPLVFTPTAKGYHFRAPTTTGALITGALMEVTPHLTAGAHADVTGEDQRVVAGPPITGIIGAGVRHVVQTLGTSPPGFEPGFQP